MLKFIVFFLRGKEVSGILLLSLMSLVHIDRVVRCTYRQVGEFVPAWDQNLPLIGRPVFGVCFRSFSKAEAGFLLEWRITTMTRPVVSLPPDPAGPRGWHRHRPKLVVRAPLVV